ncbi:MAG: ABC transporter ATP-binding protein [Anaerolineae bacterium]|nr:ABC transporter ATP-binding protein [Candidatus Roseilinea sp.]MDW8451110.1 ABC transporter ATP-binding protein [Anaerolineae bacterium]
MQSDYAVRLDRVSRHFGDVRAVDDVTFDIADGEFFTMLGPSGSGKTTCLRLIAGFDQPTSGRVFLHGQDVTGKPPYERDVNTVFQDYALFPHMNVADNIAYGLMIRKVPKPERMRRVREMLDLVQLSGFEQRKPSQLSGGQRQRVALARALINHPRVLLLDEPLGALDLKLRQQMQIELKAIQKKVGITFVFVTHDQEEALTMSDRIAVFNQGKVEQIGTPEEMYEKPATVFVAGFLGTSNLLSGEHARALTGLAGTISIRPEKIRICTADERVAEGLQSARGVVRDVVYLGTHTRYLVELDSGGDLVVIEQNLDSHELPRGQRVTLAWHPEHLRRLA